MLVKHGRKKIEKYPNSGIDKHCFLCKFCMMNSNEIKNPLHNDFQNRHNSYPKKQRKEAKAKIKEIEFQLKSEENTLI